MPPPVLFPDSSLVCGELSTFTLIFSDIVYLNFVRCCEGKAWKTLVGAGREREIDKRVRERERLREKEKERESQTK